MSPISKNLWDPRRTVTESEKKKLSLSLSYLSFFFWTALTRSKLTKRKISQIQVPDRAGLCFSFSYPPPLRYRIEIILTRPLYEGRGEKKELGPGEKGYMKPA